VVIDRPAIPFGVASGDVTGSSAIVWSRADRPCRMTVEWSTVESMKDARRGPSIDATQDGDFTAKVDLTGLPPNQRIFYRVRFMDLANPNAVSEPVTGTFKTAPLAASGAIRFAWSGDVAGQGWGIDPSRGGMTAFETMGAAPVPSHIARSNRPAPARPMTRFSVFGTATTLVTRIASTSGV
jgi:alkaline phosphatase D